MRGNKKKLLYVHNALEIDKPQKHRLCLNSIKTDRVKDIVKGIIFLEHSKILKSAVRRLSRNRVQNIEQSPSAWVKNAAVFTVWWIYHKLLSQHSFECKRDTLFLEFYLRRSYFFLVLENLEVLIIVTLSGKIMYFFFYLVTCYTYICKKWSFHIYQSAIFL